MPDLRHGLLGRRASRVVKRLFRWRKRFVLVVASLLMLFIVINIGLVSYRIWRVPGWVVGGAPTPDQMITRVTAGDVPPAVEIRRRLS